MLLDVLPQLAACRLVLASASPRRLEILRANVGVAGSIDVVPSAFAEDLDKRAYATAGDYARATAEAKGRDVLGRLPADARAVVVLCADTVVEAPSGAVLEKPADDDAAAAMLAALSGATHGVHTGVAVLVRAAGAPAGARAVFAEAFTATARVTFAPLPPALIAAYVATGEPRGKAGAYALQGAAASFVERVEGEPTTVVGLPAHATAAALRRALEAARAGPPPPAAPPALVLGAYATAPGDDDGGAFAARLLQRGGERCGLELPVLAGGLLSARGGGGGAEGEARLLAALTAAAAAPAGADDAGADDAPPPRRRHVVTLVPGTMQQLARDARFGLASDDEGGRAAAVGFARLARDAVARVCAAAGGRGAVAAVELHSAPAGAGASAAALRASLRELRAMDWCGAELVVEHCDARDGVAPVKGFLPLFYELDAIAGALRDDAERDDAGAAPARAPLGVCINWARSVLETRDPARAEEHVAAAAAAGLLRGLVVSGCGTDDKYGSWLDAHMPMDELAPGSVLKRGALERCARAAAQAAAAAGRPLLFSGVKITLQPGEAPAEVRADANVAMLDVLRGALGL